MEFLRQDASNPLGSHFPIARRKTRRPGPDVAVPARITIRRVRTAHLGCIG